MVIREETFYGGSVQLAIAANQAIQFKRAFLWVLTPSGAGLKAILPDAREVGRFFGGDYFGRAVVCILNLGANSLIVANNLTGTTLVTLTTNQITFAFLSSSATQDGTWHFRTTTSGSAASSGPAEVMYTFGGSPTATVTYRYNHQLNTWATRTAITSSHNAASAFGLGTTAVVFGHVSAPRDRVSQYTVTTNAWATLANFPEDITEQHSQASGGKGYSLGSGFSPSTNGKDTWESNASVSTWTAKTAKPNFSRLGSSEVIGALIYVASGRDNSATLIRDFEAYDTSVDTWSIKVDYPAPAAQRSAMFGTGGKIYKIGGDLGSTSSGNVLDDVFEYIPTTGLWGVKALFPDERSLMAGRAPEGQGVAAGGSADGGANQSTTWKYNQSLDTWTAGAAMPAAQTSINNQNATAALA